MLLVKGLIGGLVHVSLFGAFLLLPAAVVPGGSVLWPRALAFLALFAVVREAAVVALALAAPAHLANRVTAADPRRQPAADRLVSLAMGSSFLAWFAFVPVDHFWLRLLPAPGPGLSAVGLALFLAGWGLVVLALYSNEFAVAVVEDQAERGHALRDTGPYAWVRHPMYSGFVPYLVGAALWLESTASVVTVAGVVITVVARIAVEERMLRATLPGYAEYAERVPYRLVPYVW